MIGSITSLFRGIRGFEIWRDGAEGLLPATFCAGRLEEPQGSDPERPPMQGEEQFVPTENQRLILDCIASDPFLTQMRISEMTGLSKRMVRNNLSKMVDSGIVRKEGSKRDGRWIIPILIRFKRQFNGN